MERSAGMSPGDVLLRFDRSGLPTSARQHQSLVEGDTRAHSAESVDRLFEFAHNGESGVLDTWVLRYLTYRANSPIRFPTNRVQRRRSSTSPRRTEEDALSRSHPSETRRATFFFVLTNDGEPFLSLAFRHGHSNQVTVLVPFPRRPVRRREVSSPGVLLDRLSGAHRARARFGPLEHLDPVVESTHPSIRAQIEASAIRRLGDRWHLSPTFADRSQ